MSECYLCGQTRNDYITEAYADEIYAKQSDVFQTGLTPKFTNVLPLSQNAAGEVQNNLGYTYTVISGAGNETDATNWVSTGFIPVKQNDVLRFKDFGLPIGASSYCRILTYKADHTVASQGQINTYDADNNSTGMNYIVSPSGGTNTVVLDDAGTNIIQLTICRPGAAAYVRFTVPASGVSSKSVITVNEEIAYEAGYGTKLNGNIQVDSSQIVGDLGQRSPWDILPGAHLAIAYSSIGRMAINSKEHFQDCCKNYGYNVLKCDVRPTSDGELVLCHDAGFTLDANGRITTYNAESSTSIHEMTAAQCIALEHADSKSYGLLGYYAKPCLIGDYLDVCRAYGKVAFVTIRDEYMDVVVPKLLEELRVHNMMYHTIINSMTYASLVKWRATDSIVCLNYTLSRSANITSTEIDQVIDLGNAMIGGFGFGGTSNESDITCDFTYANEKKIRVMNAIGYVSGAYENCIAEGYDGLHIGYPWGEALVTKDELTPENIGADPKGTGLYSSFTSIPADSDLNDYTACGYFRCSSSSTAKTIANSPYSAGAFILIVSNAIGSSASSSITGTNWNYRLQRLIAISGREFFRYISSNGSAEISYDDWSEFLYTNHSDNLTSATLSSLAGFTKSGRIESVDSAAVVSDLYPYYGFTAAGYLALDNQDPANLICKPSAIRYGTWTPVLVGAASHSIQSGWYLTIGGTCIIGWNIYGSFAGSTTSRFRITGCPFTPLQTAGGGGTCSGYTSASNIIFTGYQIQKNAVIYAVGQETSTSSNSRWQSENIFQKTSGDVSSEGTIAFLITPVQN